MTLAPASFLWLLRHEVRLALRGTGVQRGWLARAGPRLALAAVPAAVGIGLAIVLALADAHAPRAHRVDNGELGLIGAAVVVLLVLMVSTAALAVLRTFHDRHDLDLLLAAPLPPARVMAAKAVGVAVGVAAPFTALFAPFALTSALLGAARWLGGLAIIAVDATLATSAALALAAALVATVGWRRARVVLQLAAAVAGAAVFLATQVQSFSPDAANRLFAAIARPWPTPLDWPARAARGEALPLLVLAAAAALLFRGAAGVGGRLLVRAGERDRGPAAARTARARFRSGAVTAVVVKELRLIARDPELIAQITLRLIYLIPLAALLLRGGGAAAASAAAAATGFAGLLAASLAWIVVCAEDAPDLLAAAPRTATLIARAKLLAACVVPVALVAAVAVALLRFGVWPAAVTLAMGTLASASAALVQSWFGRPAPRSAFRRRQSRSLVVGLGEIALAAAWAGTAELLVRGSVAAVVPALVAGTLLAGAIEAHAAAQRGAGGAGGGAGASGSSSSASSSPSARQPTR